MFADGIAALLRDFFLALFDFGIAEFFHPAALHAHQVIMVPAAVEFKHRFTAFEMVANQ